VTTLAMTRPDVHSVPATGGECLLAEGVAMFPGIAVCPLIDEAPFTVWAELHVPTEDGGSEYGDIEVAPGVARELAALLTGYYFSKPMSAGSFGRVWSFRGVGPEYEAVEVRVSVSFGDDGRPAAVLVVVFHEARSVLSATLRAQERDALADALRRAADMAEVAGK
jgi:hypothetical protein